jgi:hypothetical protein
MHEPGLHGEVTKGRIVMFVRHVGALVAVSSLGAVAICCTGRAQVVQLPSYHVTSVDTTVSVPDGGAAYLGGIYGLSEGSTMRGVPLTPFKNRAIGRSVGASTMSVHATIIDLAEMDEALLAEAAAKRAASPYGPYRVDPVVAAEASYLSAHVGRGADAASDPAQSIRAATLPQASPPAPAAPHAAAAVHASAAQSSAAAANLADRLFKSEVHLGKGTSEEASQP